MRNFRDIRIKQKLMIISMLASSVALVLVCAGFLVYEVVTSRQSALDRLATVAAVIVDNSSDALVFDDPVSAADTLAALRAESKIVAACIFRSDGQLFASYHRDPGSQECPPQFESGQAPKRKGDIVFALPMIVEGEQVGRLLICSDSIKVSEQIWRYGGVVVLAMLASGLLAFWLSSKLQRFISGPILHLVETSRSVSADRDYSVRAVREGEDEVGLLIDSFNEMLHQIQERDSALERQRGVLEDEVQLRTADLVAAVDELREEVDQRKVAEEQIRYMAPAYPVSSAVRRA